MVAAGDLCLKVFNDVQHCTYIPACMHTYISGICIFNICNMYTHTHILGIVFSAGLASF